MAWPPATLPTNRTNATPQQDTHPTDHNTLAQAINDTVGHIQTGIDAALAAQTLLAINTGQAVAGQASTALSYTQLSSSAWGGPISFTFPATGLFILSLRCLVAAAPAIDTFGDLIITAAGVVYQVPFVPGKGGTVITIMNQFSAGQTFNTSVYNANPAATTFTPQLAVCRVPAT